MPRPLRNFVAGGIYHVTCRGNRKENIFLADDDMSLFIHLLAQVIRARRWRCHAYCLMPNHYHLLIEIRDNNLSAGLQRLNGHYARLFNDKYRVTGHVFQGRFYAISVDHEGHLFELTRYLALNPVRAGLCSRPEQWPWSSFRAAVGLAKSPAFLETETALGFWASGPGAAPRAIRRFVGEGSPA